MTNTDELVCVYADLILADDQAAITGDKISALLKAANVSDKPYWPGLFSKALDGLNVKELISNVGSAAGAGSVAESGGAPAAVVPAAGCGDAKPAAAKAKKEEKKEESEESYEDMGLGLFD